MNRVFVLMAIIFALVSISCSTLNRVSEDDTAVEVANDSNWNYLAAETGTPKKENIVEKEQTKITPPTPKEEKITKPLENQLVEEKEASKEIIPVKDSVPKEKTSEKTSIPTKPSAPEKEDETLKYAKGTYFIVLGTYAEEKNAECFKTKLIKQGFDNPVILSSKTGKLRRVCIMGYEDFNYANERLLSIRKQFPEYNDAWIMKKD